MESPYERYLDTNYAPTVEEARNIQAIVDQSAKEIAHLNAQVETLQKQINILHEKREKIQIFSDRHQALLSPMRKLTRDVLEEIFLACLPIDRNPCMSATDAPMLLTRICSSWRKIALSAPRIWAKLHIPLPVIQIERYAAENELAVQEERLRSILKLRETAVIEWLNRSYACPLSISVYQTCSWTHPELSEKYFIVCEELRNFHVSFMRSTIVPHHKRWRDLDLCAADDTLCGFLDIGLKAENLENLESLHITRQLIYTPRDQTLPFQWKNFVSLMPQHITGATFHGFPIRNLDFPSIPQHSWENLAELNLKLDEDSSSSPVHAVRFAASILRHCHSLKTLSLIIWPARDDSFELLQTEDIILQHLTTLTISIPLSQDALAFAKLLYLPSINDLGFQFCATEDNNILELVQEMITSILRATGNLSVIRMYLPSWASSFDDLVEVLKFTPELRRLEISSKAATMEMDRWPITSYFHTPQPYFRKVVNNSLLEALMPTNRPAADIICPKLEVLMSDNLLITGITERCLKDFIMSRENDERVPSLRRISVYIDEPKQQQLEDSNNTKISLGYDSAVYFKKKQPCRYSPFDGVNDDFKFVNIQPFGSGALPSDCYNEL